MKIVEMWIVNGHQLLVKTENGDYLIGTTSSCYGFDKITQERAEKLIAESESNC